MRDRAGYTCHCGRALCPLALTPLMDIIPRPLQTCPFCAYNSPRTPSHLHWSPALNPSSSSCLHVASRST